MSKEDKELLLKDLCARLPYGVKCSINDLNNCTLMPSDIEDEKNIKPYLRPLSSMTEAESSELEELTDGWFYHDTDDDCNDVIYPIGQHSDSDSFDFIIRGINWLNANHFDYQNLIEKGLALEAPEDMYER